MSLPWRGFAASLIFLTALASSATASPARMEGTWDSPLGILRVDESAGVLEGRLLEASSMCPGFEAGTEILRGHLVDDVFTGELRVCVPSGSPCGSGDAWLLALISTSGTGPTLTGAVEDACRSPALEGAAFQLKRAKAPEVVKEREPKEREPVRLAKLNSPARSKRHTRPEVRELIDEAIRLIRDNNMDNAQRKLMQAEGLDPKNPEIFVQHGISFYIRKNYKMAEHYYQRALAVDPSHVVAHYNLACAVALQGRKIESLNHLRSAVENGFGDLEALDHDADLSSLRSLPEFKELRASAARRQKR